MDGFTMIRSPVSLQRCRFPTQIRSVRNGLCTSDGTAETLAFADFTSPNRIARSALHILEGFVRVDIGSLDATEVEIAVQ